jgi:hypothetical protein
MENSMGSPQKRKVEQAYDPAIRFLGTYPKEMKSAYKRDNCISKFIVALYIITKI